MRPRFCTIAALMLALVGPPVIAMYVPPELENVPIERVIANLERLVAETPNDIPLRLNLARVNAMAFAQKTTTAPVWKGREREGAWTGHEPKYTQFPVRRARNVEDEKIARAHLNTAIALYRDVRTLATTTPAPERGYPGRLDLVADLGLGWCLIQVGQPGEAIAALRRVTAGAWPHDRKSGGLHIGHRTLFEEAALHLLPLLDSVKDRDEIATLKRRAAEASTIARFITPIAVPLRTGLSAFDITASDGSVLFDADGSGVAKRWTWITPDAGWLVYDRRGTRRIDSALQLFGSVTFWLFWENGYQAMRALDDNGDGRLADAELEGLAIWHDRNANAQSEAGEVQPLTAWDIVALSCAYEIDAAHPDEIAYSPAGVTFRDGSRRPTFDVIFHRAAGQSFAKEPSR